MKTVISVEYSTRVEISTPKNIFLKSLDHGVHFSYITCLPIIKTHGVTAVRSNPPKHVFSCFLLQKTHLWVCGKDSKVYWKSFKRFSSTTFRFYVLKNWLTMALFWFLSETIFKKGDETPHFQKLARGHEDMQAENIFLQSYRQ